MDHRHGGIIGPDQRAPSRRDFLKAAGIGVAGTVVAGTVVGGLGRGARPASAATTSVSLIATDGYITLPGRESNPVYVFGFRDVTSDPDHPCPISSPRTRDTPRCPRRPWTSSRATTCRSR